MALSLLKFPAGRTSVVYRAFAEPKSRSSISVGLQTLNLFKDGGGSAIQKQYYDLHVAALVARLPVAAITYRNQILPRVQKDRSARSTR